MMTIMRDENIISEQLTLILPGSISLASRFYCVLSFNIVSTVGLLFHHSQHGRLGG